ncbi:MAG TPA: hypothetical protein VLD55_02665 [Candidatus Sulfobium mesophilum]|nr:hypothetical protein [Candidatus Sulfobium mesophilum]
MIHLKEFLNIFKNTGFTEDELKKFYYSVKKSVILRYLGKRSWPSLFKLEAECQWPVLQRIDDPNLPIYKGADSALLNRFIKTISAEKELRAHRSSMHKVRYWSLLQAVIDERLDILASIFGFSEKDMKHCELIAERIGKTMERKAREKKKLWQIGIGAGAATLAGAAAIWYISQKDKK